MFQKTEISTKFKTKISKKNYRILQPLKSCIENKNLYETKISKKIQKAKLSKTICRKQKSPKQFFTDTTHNIVFFQLATKIINLINFLHDLLAISLFHNFSISFFVFFFFHLHAIGVNFLHISFLYEFQLELEFESLGKAFLYIFKYFFSILKQALFFIFREIFNMSFATIFT